MNNKLPYFLTLEIVEPSFDRSYVCDISVHPNMIETEVHKYDEVFAKVDLMASGFNQYFKRKLDSLFFLDSQISKKQVIDDFTKYINEEFNVTIVELKKSDFFADKNDLRAAFRGVIRKVESRFNNFKTMMESDIPMDAKDLLHGTVDDISLCIASLKRDIRERIEKYYKTIAYFKQKQNIPCKVYFIDPQKHDYDIIFYQDEQNTEFKTISMFVHSECYRFIRKEISERFLRYAEKFKLETDKLFRAITTISCLEFFQKYDNIKLRMQTIMENKDVIDLFVDSSVQKNIGNLELFETTILGRMIKIKDVATNIQSKLSVKGKLNVSADTIMMLVLQKFLSKSVIDATALNDTEFNSFVMDELRYVIELINYGQKIDLDQCSGWVLPMKIANTLFPQKVQIFWDSLKLNKLIYNFNCIKIDDDADFGLTGQIKREDKNSYKEAYHWYAIGMPNKKEHYKKIILQKMCMVEYSHEITIAKNDDSEMYFKIQCSYVIEKCLLNNGIVINFKAIAQND